MNQLLLRLTPNSPIAEWPNANEPPYRDRTVTTESESHDASRGESVVRFTAGGEDFAAAVAQVLDLTDRIGLVLNPSEEAVARSHSVTTAHYEWMFFDAAYRREDWPV